MDETEIKVTEWKDVRESLRYFGNKRFAQLTVFIAAQGAAITAYFNSGASYRRLVFQIAGLFLAGIFYIMERSAVIYWKAFATRGEAIEAEVPQLKLMSEHRPKERGLWSATNATYFLYLCVAVFWLFSFFWWSIGPAHPKVVRIVVAGDDRAKNGVAGFNQQIANEIVQATLKEKADMLLWTGDLANLAAGDTASLTYQLTTWRNVFEPLYSHHVTVLPVRGNHEVVWYDNSPEESKIEKPRDAWNKVFSGRYALPHNGPDGEENLSFYYTLGPVLVIGLDQYGTERYEDRRHSINQPWLEWVLNNNKKPFIFTFGHEPAFCAGRHDDDETLAADKPGRDRMWETLIKAGARVYFCGHDHFYDHMTVFRNNGDPGPQMHQLTAGTAGAPMYEGGTYSPEDTNWNRTSVRHIDNKPGYVLIVVEGDIANITFKGQTSSGVYDAMDSFSYCAARP